MAEQTHADRAAINALFETMEQTYKARDLDAFVECFDDKVVCLPPGQHPIIGRAAWREWLSPWWDKSKVLEMTATYHVELAGDWAIEWHTERQVTIPATGGDESEKFFSGMWTLRRQGDNSWKIAHYCWHRYPGPDQ